MESREETHTPAKPEMEKKKKSIPSKLHWLSSYVHGEIRVILSSDWEQKKLIGCMDFYIRYAREESVKGKKATNLAKIIPRSMYLFKDMNTKIGPTPAYLDRIAQMLQLYLDAELRSSIQGIIFYVDIANKISMQIDVHLKGHDPSYILSVFLTSQRSQNKSHRLVLDLLYSKYLTVQKWSVNRTELPDRLMLMYVIGYKQWVNLFLDDKTKVLDIMKKFTMFKPQDSFITNPKIPESLRTVFSQSGLVKELLTTCEKVDVLKTSLASYLDEDVNNMEDFLVDDLTKMTMSISGSGETSLFTAEMDSIVSVCPGVSRPESVPVPLCRSAMSRVVKQEEPQTLAIIDLTDEEMRPQARQWLQNLVRKARDKQEVAMARCSSPGVADVICLSDSDESEEPGDGAENSVEPTSDAQMSLTGNLMEWAEGANSMAKNREMLDSITSNLDEVPSPHKLPTQQRAEKSSLTSVSATKSAMKFGVRDDLVGSSPRKVTTGESVSETSICTAEDNSLSGGVEDSQNSVDNYPIFNEIRMVERGGENYERVTDIEAPPMDHEDYFCDDLEEGCHILRTTPDKRRRQSTDAQHQENIVFTMPPLTRRPLPTDDDPVVAITSSGSLTTSDRILFSTGKSTQLPIDESLNNIVRDIMADFSDVDEIMPEDEDVSMDEEPEIESPSMETIEKAELVQFMEQICESERQNTPEPIKSILDRSTPKEKSAKVKKKVKFGTAQYLEPDDVPQQRFGDYFGGMSPRKAILKSSLKRTLQSASMGGGDSVRIVKDYSKTPMSNIMVKRTYLSPDMLPHSQASRSVSNVTAQLSTEPIVKPSESETDSPRKVLPSKTVVTQSKLAIRREFEDRRKKVRRRNSIACIDYTEPVPLRVADEPLPQVVEEECLSVKKSDPKLFKAYVPVVKIAQPLVDNSPSTPVESAEKKLNVPDPLTATPLRMSQDMREKPWKDYPLYTGLTPTRMTRSMRKRILDLELQDDDYTPMRKPGRLRLMSTIELVSPTRLCEESKAVPPNIDTPVTCSQSQESPVPSRIESSKRGRGRRKSINVEMRKIAKVQHDVSQPSVVLQNLNEFSELPKTQDKFKESQDVAVTKCPSILPITKASKVEVVSPSGQIQEPSASSSTSVGEDRKESNLSTDIEVLMQRAVDTPVVRVERVKTERNIDIKTSPKAALTVTPSVPRREDLIPLSKRTMKTIRKDVKLCSLRAVVRIPRLTSSHVERIVDQIEKKSDSKIELKSGQFFQMQASKNGNLRDEISPPMAGLHNNSGSEMPEQGDPVTETIIEVTDQLEEESVSESAREGAVDASTNEDEDCNLKNTKRGRRSEGKRSKTPRRLKRSQSYQKIIEDSFAMEQIQAKPLPLLSLNEEIGKMASPDSTSSHGEANKNVEEQFQGKAVSPEYVNPSISSTVNTEISSTTQIAGGSLKASSQVDKKQHRLGFNGPVLRSMSSMGSRGSASPQLNTEAVSCDSQGDLCEPKKGKSPQCDSQTEEKSPENHQESSNASDEGKSGSDETIENQIEEIMKEDDKQVEEEDKSKESPLGCDSQGDSSQIEECEMSKDTEEDRQEEEEAPAEEEEKKCEETMVPVSEVDAETKKCEDGGDQSDASIDFQDFDTVSEYSNLSSPSSVDDSERTCDKTRFSETLSAEMCDPDKSIDAAMMHFDPSDAFKDTSDVESQDDEDNMNMNQEMHEKDNLFENISSIESTEQNYLVDNCALLTSHQAEGEDKIPSPDSSNVHCTSGIESDPMGISCDATNTLGMDDQERYVEHDGLFSSPIYDPEPLDVNPVDQRNKFNHQLMYTGNQLLEADSSENIGENLAIDDLVEEMPSDETTLITESDIFEEYCENLTSIGDNVTVETESEIVTEPFGEAARQTTDTVDFASVFKTCLPEMTSVATSLPAVSTTFLSTTFPSDPTDVTATRKSYRQRIKSHTNLYVGHDYSPKTDTNRVTPMSTKTGDRYLLPPKSDRLNKKRSLYGDGRERKRNRHKMWINPTSLPYNPTTKSLPDVQKICPPKIDTSSSVSSYLEVHNNLQQQIEKESRATVFPLPPVVSINGETSTIRRYRRPSRMDRTPPPVLPVYEQISPCVADTRAKAFKMIPSNQSIAALETMSQKSPSIEILSDKVIQPRKDSAPVFPQGIGEYELMTANPPDFCIMSSRQQENFSNSAVSSQTTHTVNKAFLTPQPEELPHFVVHDSDLVGDCLSEVK